MAARDLLQQAVDSQQVENKRLYETAVYFALKGTESREDGVKDALIAATLELGLKLPCTSPDNFDGGRADEARGRAGGDSAVRWRKSSESVWQLCYEAARHCDSQSARVFVSGQKYFQVCVSELLVSSLRVGARALRVRESVECFLEQVCKHFWSYRISQFVTQVKLVEPPASNCSNQPSGASLNAVWSECIKCSALLHTAKAIHTTLLCTLEETGLSSMTTFSLLRACEKWLCVVILEPLATWLAFVAPRAIHSVYQQWWAKDTQKLRENDTLPVVACRGKGLVLKVGMCMSHRLGGGMVES